MALSSYKVFLMAITTLGTGSGEPTWTKLIDIKDFPDLYPAPEALETTTLSNKSRTYIPGIQDSDSMTFTANYTKADFDKLVAADGLLCGYAVWFGGTESNGSVTPTGSDGKYAFGGYLTPTVNGAGVNEVVEMTITIARSTDFGVDGTIDWGDQTPVAFPA